MRSAEVRRTALLLALALLGAAAGSAWLAAGEAGRAGAAAEPPAGPADGRTLYGLHCAPCHAETELRAPLAGADPAAAVLELLELLDGHGDSDARQDRAIVAYLLAAGR